MGMATRTSLTEGGRGGWSGENVDVPLWMSHFLVCKYHDLGCGCPTSWCGCPVDVPHVPLWMSHFSVDVPLWTKKKKIIKKHKNEEKKKPKMWVSYFCVDVPVWVSYTYHHVPPCGTSTPKCGCPTRTTLCGSTSHYPWYIHTTPLWNWRLIS